MKVGVLLSGSGVYDGSEIHEAVLTLLALDKVEAEVICFAPDVEQHHVVNHITGEEMPEKRNVLIEAARIARGNIKPLSEAKAEDLDALAIPGGFGAAKNLTKWAFSGPEGDILPEVKALIVSMVEKMKPIAAMCMGPTVVAKALEGSGVTSTLTVGNIDADSPYEIEAISKGMEAVGVDAKYCPVDGVIVDDVNNIITSPCYMMTASISEINAGIEKAIAKLLEMTNLQKQS